MIHIIIKTTFFFLCCTCYTLYAQENQPLYNLPDEYIVLKQEMVDFNKDKLMDSLVFLEKKNKQDGDSILVLFYIRNNDGSLKHFKTFGNLYPLYFKSYQPNYEMTDTSLLKVFHDYIGLMPHNQILIKNKTITIIKKPNAITYEYEFVFNTKRNNWFLASKNIHSPKYTNPTEKYFLNDPRAISLDKYNFLLDIK